MDGELGSLRSSAGDFATSTSSCVIDDHPDVVLMQGPDPLPGQTFYYLVRAVLPGGPLSYDGTGPSQVEPRDAEILGSGVACP